MTTSGPAITVVHPIAAPAEQVWSIISRLEAWAELLPTIDHVRRLDRSDEPIGIGSRFLLRQPALPPATWQVTDWQPGHGFVWRSTAPGITSVAEHWIEPTAAGVALRLRVAWSGPIGAIIGRLLNTRAQQLVQSEADTFAELAEAASAR